MRRHDNYVGKVAMSKIIEDKRDRGRSKTT